MYKALKAIERSYQRSQLRSFVLNQKQFTAKPTVSQRDVAMQHNIKKGVR